MTKKTVNAIRYLPRRYNNGKAFFCEFIGIVVACNGRDAPIFFCEKTKKWKRIKFTDKKEAYISAPKLVKHTP